MAKGVRWRIILAAVVGMLAVVAGVARLAVAAVVIFKIIHEDAAFSALAWPLVGMAGLILVRSGLQYLQEVISHHTASVVKVALRERLYNHCLALGPGYFDQSRTGDVLMSLAEGVERLEAFFGRYLPQMIVAALAPIFIFVFMALIDFRTGLVFLAFALLTLVLPNLFHRWTRNSSMARRDAYGALGADFLDAVQGLPTLKAFGQSRARGVLLADRARTLFRTTMGVLAANSATSALTILGISAGAAVALAWGAVRVSNGELELRSLLIVLMLGVEIFRPLRELTQLYHDGMIAMSSAEGIFDIMDAQVEVADAAETGVQLELSAEITFEGVDYAYSGGRRPALHDLSFTLNAGETLGLVGPSGAGKSTVVWSMLRFFDPQKGRILLGGTDIREIPLKQLREQMAVVTQDTYLFHGTVAENLRFGGPGATQEQLEAAASAANAHEFIRHLPQGYDTIVGERAVRLSGGQKQRIAIARALLKDAPILVLDEALSSVDAENEALIQEALDHLMEGRTTLIIAHRLSSVVKADRIIVLEEGRLVESGNHGELVAAGGVYAELMAQQQEIEDDHADRSEPAHAPDEPAQAVVQDAEAFVPQPAHQGEGHHHHAVPSGGAAHAPASALGIFTVWRRLFQLVRPWRGELALTFLLGLAHHSAVIGLSVISALLVGQVITGGDLNVLLWLLGVFVPLAAFFTWAESWVAHDLAYRLLAEMRVDVYNKLDPLTPAYMVRRRSGDLVSIVGGDVELVEFFFAHTITPAFVAVLVPAGVLATLAFVAWPIALVLSPFLVAVAISPFMAQKRSEGLGEELRSQLGEVHAHMVDSIQGMREISAFGQGPARTAEMVDNSWKFAHFQLRFLKERAFQIGFIEGMTALGGLAVLTMGVWLMTQGDISRPQLILSVILSVAAFAPISDIARTIKQLMETLAAARRLFVVHDEPVPVTDGPGVHGHENGRSSQNGRSPALSFDHVGFSYGHGEAQALHGVTFDVESGQTVALVGRSGAGKTTCANLVMRFWDPGEGHVRLSGHDLRDFELEDLRRQIALVSQDTYLFNASIRENLKLGKIEATDEEIEDAAHQANAHEFITAFPDGYDTLVGERGMQLSGGQRQRISIARALLKNASLLILDEATSHLDAVNERQVRQALETLMEGRTTVVIAHRLSTIRDADRIVVLDNGHAVEQGSHRDLLASNGLYSRLVATQLLGATTGVEHNAQHEGHHDEHDGDGHDGHGDHQPGPMPDMPDVNPHHHH
ncbi:MAG: thiol reductant ABC exporter subunit CydC [SAR202 cluster bacterium MP-NPac-SRR3961935-G1]|nr:MAG: thiol reductant ABC exporter subunit CydC [SAR202 cluster bacterium MP-SInd-SRR3963457-G1]PKB83649.1 MAG: thiol reductant ABC exporter subunit CydC [SAR202 cluster bacterium MP-NPac-SRR3961935-G1]